MARYIDADALYKETQKKIAEANSYRMAVVDSEFLDLINDAETEDVVPKSEVEKIFEEIEKIRLKEIHKCETLREQENEVSQRKYWEGGYNSLRQLSYWLAELKKKYTDTSSADPQEAFVKMLADNWKWGEEE